MEFIFLDAEGVGKFETKFRDELLEKSELTLDELALLSKREFNELVNTIFSDVVVTKDNIHLYYEFMSDKDKRNNKRIITDLFMDRKGEVLWELEINNTKSSFNVWGGLSILGVKDTLKPIDEYIAEIKGSEEYKAYIMKKSEIFMAFEISRSIIFNVAYYTLGNNKNPRFNTSADEFNKPKSDYRRCGQAQDSLLPDGVAKDFYLKWDKHHLEDLPEKLYLELKNDLETLKDSYNYISKDSDISFYEAKELSKRKLK